MKTLVPLGGRPLLQHVIDAATASTCDEVIVVLGHRADDVRAAIDLGRARAVLNPDHASGRASSVRAGLRAATEADAVVVLNGDQPLVTAALIDAVIDRARRTGAAAVMSARDGRRSPPTLLRRDLWPAIEALEGESGPREILSARIDVEVVEATPDLGDLADIDRPRDLARIERA